MKTCARCHAVKDNEEFRRRGAGLQSYCKDCQRILATHDPTNELAAECATLPMGEVGKRQKRASRTDDKSAQ